MDYYYLKSSYNASLASVAPIDIFDPVYGAEVGQFEEFFVQRYSQSQLGIYAQEQATLWDRLTLLAGGRMDFVWTRDADVLFDSTVKADDSKFSPRAGIAWEFVPGISVYGNFSKSFFPQAGFTSVDGEALPPETGTQWEGGVKTLYFDGRVQSTLAVYHITKNNVAVDDPNNPGFFDQHGRAAEQGVRGRPRSQRYPGLGLHRGLCIYRRRGREGQFHTPGHADYKRAQERTKPVDQVRASDRYPPGSRSGRRGPVLQQAVGRPSPYVRSPVIRDTAGGGLLPEGQVQGADKFRQPPRQKVFPPVPTATNRQPCPGSL